LIVVPSFIAAVGAVIATSNLGRQRGHIINRQGARCRQQRIGPIIGAARRTHEPGKETLHLGSQRRAFLRSGKSLAETENRLLFDKRQSLIGPTTRLTWA